MVWTMEFANTPKWRKFQKCLGQNPTTLRSVCEGNFIIKFMNFICTFGFSLAIIGNRWGSRCIRSNRSDPSEKKQNLLRRCSHLRFLTWDSQIGNDSQVGNVPHWEVLNENRMRLTQKPKTKTAKTIVQMRKRDDSFQIWEFLKFLKLRRMYSKKSMDNSRFDWGSFGTETSWPWFKSGNVGDLKGDSNRIKFHSERHAIGAELGQNKHGRTKDRENPKRTWMSIGISLLCYMNIKRRGSWNRVDTVRQRWYTIGIPNKCPRYRPESIVYIVSSRYYRVTTNVHRELFLVRLWGTKLTDNDHHSPSQTRTFRDFRCSQNFCVFKKRVRCLS